MVQANRPQQQSITSRSVAWALATGAASKPRTTISKAFLNLTAITLPMLRVKRLPPEADAHEVGASQNAHVLERVVHTEQEAGGLVEQPTAARGTLQVLFVIRAVGTVPVRSMLLAGAQL